MYLLEIEAFMFPGLHMAFLALKFALDSQFHGSWGIG
jgi:hypothetical protein